jgi:hypothetical protein
MTSQSEQDTGLDGLLKRALADDLPAGVEAGMRERIARFRAETTEVEGRAEGRTRLRWRIAWAAASVLMLVSGSLLQGLQPRSPLAEKISLVMTEISDIESTRRARSTPEIRLISPEREPVPVPEDKERKS